MKKPQRQLSPERELAERVAASMGMLPVMSDARLERRQDRFENS